MERQLELPKRLNRSQSEALNVPYDGIYLIVGGPGTGKSVLTLRRSQELADEGINYCFLIYNQTLIQYSTQLTNKAFKQGLVCKQWQAWFLDVYKRKIAGDLGEGLNWDWGKIINNIELALDENDHIFDDINQQHLVIDEGQDMPPQFYQALITMGFSNLYIAADQNQQLQIEKNSTIEQIRYELGITIHEQYDLMQNYRNTKQIALFTQTFYTDPACEKPELPQERHGATPMLYEYQNQTQLMRGIINQADNDKSKLIGVICPNNEVRERYFKLLCQTSKDLNKPINIMTYSNKDKSMLTFNQGGIIVINNQSCKGLEFDFVHLADIDEYPVYTNNDIQLIGLKKRFYVMTSRAKERLFLLKYSLNQTNIEEILSKDNNILERKKDEQQ